METSLKLSREDENAIIQRFVLKHYKEMDTYEIANKLGIKPFRVAANKAYLKRVKKIGEGEKMHQWQVYAIKAKEKKKGVSIEFKKTQDNPKNEKNTYKNHNGANKAIAREKMANIIIKSGVTGIIPCLPNEDWFIEKMIFDKAKANTFLGVERDKPTYKIMCSKLTELKKGGFFAGVHHGNISDVIYGRFENSYAHMILDYCGQLKTIKKELEYSIQNNILAVGGIMAVTFAKAIRGTDAESLKLLDLVAENSSDSRCASDKAVEAYFHKITGFTHKVVEFFHYRDTSPMTLVLIKRIK